jgi:hypothetical protein
MASDIEKLSKFISFPSEKKMVNNIYKALIKRDWGRGDLVATRQYVQEIIDQNWVKKKWLAEIILLTYLYNGKRIPEKYLNGAGRLKYYDN